MPLVYELDKTGKCTLYFRLLEDLEVALQITVLLFHRFNFTNEVNLDSAVQPYRGGHRDLETENPHKKVPKTKTEINEPSLTKLWQASKSPRDHDSSSFSLAISFSAI